MATTGVSSVVWHNLSRNVTKSLVSALLEWFLILFLFVDAVFSYVITKFASYCKLQIPCLFCSRLDHVLGKEKRGYCWDLICSGHKSEISSLVLCRAHDRLVNVEGICENCFSSFATTNKSNAETNRLLVGEFGEQSASRFDQDPLLGDHSITKRCSCCDEQWILNSYDQRLVFNKTIESAAADFDELDAVRNNFHEKKRKPSLSVSTSNMKSSQLDPLSYVGYTEVKVTSDTESECEVPLSDDDGTSIPVHGTVDTKEDIKVLCEHVDPRIVDLNEDLASGRASSSASPIDQSLLHRGTQLENRDIHGTESASATMGSGNSLKEHYWPKFERDAVYSSPSEPISFDDTLTRTLSNKMEVPVEVAKENYDLTTNERGLTSEQKSTMDGEEIIKSGDKLSSSEAGFEPNSVSSDISQQSPTLLDLGDAYKLAVGNKGRQLSGMLVEQWLGKDSTRVSEDLKMLLSQFSATRGSDLSFNDISPRLSLNGDEVKASDVSNSAGMQILQKMISLERNESGLSLDGSMVSDIEGESPVDRLKRQVDHDRKLMNALYKELEEERNASAVAANQALAMITRLQEEKAALHMEALQYLRMMDEESEYDTEALQKANDLLAEKDKEIEELEAKLEFYRKKFPDESLKEKMLETSSEMKVKDIGLDHSQCPGNENDERIMGKPATENPNISNKAEVHLLATSEEKNVLQSVRSSPMQFEEERRYISQRLKKLEKQVYLFLNMHHSEDNNLNSGSSEKESPEICEKFDNNLMMQDSVSSLKVNSDVSEDDFSSKKPPVFDENGHLNYDDSSNFVGRLQILEQDLSFLEHSINLLNNGDKGLVLLQEIADNLQQLRRVGITEIHQTVS